MKREEALQHFMDECVAVHVRRLQEKVDQQFRDNKEMLLQPIIAPLEQLFSNIKQQQAQQKLEAVAFIHFSLLRTSLLEGKCTYLLEAYGEAWYYDWVECTAQYEAAWLSEAMIDLQRALEKERKLYFVIQAADIRAIIQKMMILFHLYIIQLVRYLFRYKRESVPELDFKRAACLRFRVGEYKGFSEDVGIINERQQDESLLSWLEKKEVDKSYTFESFSHLPLQQKDFKQLDFSYAYFDGSDLTNATLQKCVCIGTSFVDCQLMNADFSYTALQGADFRNANLTGANFTHAQGNMLKLADGEVACSLAIDFSNANLENAKFEFAQLGDAIFTDANLKGAIFFKRDQARYQFSPEQIRVIHWLE
ncbi:pentapeptide repeat-containing protein [Metasolibacillus meyeri]|uniref:Pentapeptide repeat-containing protein n=1 Tax=Metasolibacillus meyeri TaxID=1071052 RepID=A0AAW9NUB8_9BACL|nr:pentapeptide repeat-containing protein [Metasolibacillus meyeri]MEC1179997.1 pentapeptide repeat-containing protein [Metasolibacillus meyeri]